MPSHSPKPAHHTPESTCQPGSPSPCCGVPATPSLLDLERRDFLRLTGLTSLAWLTSRGGAMAGPFVKEDFLKLIPTDKKLDPAWLKSLTARGVPETFTGGDLHKIGMPVGGLFCGTVYLGGDGRLWLWDVFNTCQLGIDPAGSSYNGTPLNPIFGSSYVAPLVADGHRRLEQGFTIAVKTGDKEIRRTLDSTAGTGFREVSFTGQYPIGTVRYADPELPVKVRLEAFSPFIPHDIESSSIPATIFSFEIENTGKETAEIALEGHLENAVYRNTGYLDGIRRAVTIDGAGATVVALSAQAQPPGASGKPDVIFEDWSGGTFAEKGWIVEGDAFGKEPVNRKQLPAYMGDIGGDSERVVNSHAGNAAQDPNGRDAATGKLISKTFTIERKFLRFWIAGGTDPATLGLRLIVDGKVARSATGPTANPLVRTILDVTEFLGREAHIEIIDAHTQPWGHTSVGSITFTDTPPITAEQFARLPDAGSMALALIGAPAELREADREAKLGEKVVGRVGRKLSLAAGEKATVDFVVAWHFPHAPANVLGGREHAYAKRFADAAAATAHIAANFKRLAGETRLWRDTWNDSTLPHWFLNRTFANTSILATTTCYYFEGGRFWAMEGVGCCAGTCIHVWQYAQAVARLFPKIERDHREFVDFGVALKPDGTIAYRGEDGDWYAVDGQAGRILGAYREYLMSADPAFLQRVWPNVKKALGKIITTDADGDGIIRGPLHNTLDADWNGIVPWLCGMYHAALKAGETMAVEMGDMSFASQCRQILAVAAKNLDQLCWNKDYGYYVHIGDPARKTEVGAYEGCHIDQVFGQSWAWQVGLGDVMTRGHVRKALESLWKYNFTPDVGPFRAGKKSGRWYAMPGEGGMVMLSNPFVPDIEFTGPSAPTSMYFNECMSGFEHQVASHMVWEDMITEGLATTRVIHDRYHPSLRNPYNEIECSDHYARAMASYGTFLAACGFEYNGPKGFIGFAPRLTPENFKAAFTTAEGWGSFSQKLDGTTLNVTLALKWGRLKLNTLSLGRPEMLNTARNAEATLNGKSVACTLTTAGGRALVTFAPQLEIPAGGSLNVKIS